jgi:hypothetical protein
MLLEVNKEFIKNSTLNHIDNNTTLHLNLKFAIFTFS